LKKLLLIVDDWERLERLEERFIADFEVLCAPFGSEGLRLADEELPDVILIDLSFEDMTVEEVHAKILERQHLKHVKIFDLSQGADRLSLDEIVRRVKA